jgi:hypothetical protein
MLIEREKLCDAKLLELETMRQELMNKIKANQSKSEQLRIRKKQLD